MQARAKVEPLVITDYKLFVFNLITTPANSTPATLSLVLAPSVAAEPFARAEYRALAFASRCSTLKSSPSS